MTTRVQNARAQSVASRPTEKAPAARPAAKPKAGFLRDELSTGKGRAHRSAAQRTVGAGAAAAQGSDVQAAFERRIAALELAVAKGVPGAREELEAVRRDRDGIGSAIADLEAKLAANEDPKAWEGVTPKSRARAEQADVRAQLQRQLSAVKDLGVKVSKMNAKERQDLQNFFRLAKEDPAAFKRFVESQAPGAPRAEGPGSATPTQAPAPVGSSAPADAPPGIQAAIAFGLSQLGAPYVGGASPFRFGTPGDGNTYQQEGQRAHLSPKGVIGYDCSGLMVTMLKKAGIDISRFPNSRLMKKNLPEVPKDQLRPGDLLVKNGHVSMYLGDGKMIESVPGGVRVTSAKPYLDDPAYSGHRPG
ncbi:MAG: C40 family peptidase [Myxococcaceae bacterium]|nr:C40 family peptidase [Myxococcaceae bacterium]MCA3011787.1 C40 family peptidase [Myxococcaceae bacterium]